MFIYIKKYNLLLLYLDLNLLIILKLFIQIATISPLNLRCIEVSFPIALFYFILQNRING